MLDTRLEERLRAALRAADDDLPMTVTSAELERRLATRRRQRNGRRLSLVAAAVAVVAISSIVAISNGWILGRAVVGGLTPSLSPGSSASPAATLASSAPPTPAVAGQPIGASTDAIVVQQLAASGVAGERLQVTLVHADMTTTPVATLDETAFPAGSRVNLDHPMRVSSSGYLLVQLLDGLENPAGAVLYDLHDPAAKAQLLDGPNVLDYVWGPTGLLAADSSDIVTITDPAQPSTAPRVVSVPSNVSIATNGPGRGLAWSADGLGLIADRDVNATVVRGVLGLDGIFTVNPSPRTFAATGLERSRNPAGQALTLGCDENPAPGAAACHVTARVPSIGVDQAWYDPAVHTLVRYQLWSANGSAIWLLLEDQPAGATTRTLRVLTGGPKTYRDVIVVNGLAPAGDVIPTAFSGLAPDDTRIVIDTGAGQLLLVDTGSDASASFQGSFAGWADSRAGFTFPGTAALPSVP